MQCCYNSHCLGVAGEVTDVKIVRVMGVDEDTIGEWNNKGMTTATDKGEQRFNGGDWFTKHESSIRQNQRDLSVAKGKNQTKQAKLTANTADHTAANLTKLSQKYSG